MSHLVRLPDCHHFICLQCGFSYLEKTLSSSLSSSGGEEDKKEEDKKEEQKQQEQPSQHKHKHWSEIECPLDTCHKPLGRLALRRIIRSLSSSSSSLSSSSSSSSKWPLANSPLLTHSLMNESLGNSDSTPSSDSLAASSPGLKASSYWSEGPVCLTESLAQLLEEDESFVFCFLFFFLFFNFFFFFSFFFFLFCYDPFFLILIILFFVSFLISFINNNSPITLSLCPIPSPSQCK